MILLQCGSGGLHQGHAYRYFSPCKPGSGTEACLSFSNRCCVPASRLLIPELTLNDFTRAMDFMNGFVPAASRRSIHSLPSAFVMTRSHEYTVRGAHMSVVSTLSVTNTSPLPSEAKRLQQRLHISHRVLNQTWNSDFGWALVNSPRKYTRMLATPLYARDFPRQPALISYEAIIPSWCADNSSDFHFR